jgi:hypothetical protein
MKFVQRIWRYAVELAREISDENAYERRLRQIGRPHSPAEWRLFIDERLRRKYRNGKCC